MSAEQPPNSEPNGGSPPGKPTVITLGAAHVKLTGQPITIVTTAYEAAANVATSANERDALLRLRNDLKSFDEAELYVIAHDKEVARPRVGNPAIAETTAKTLVMYEWERRRWAKERWRWLVAGVLIPVALGLIALAGRFALQ